jgi:CRP/FNR family transcriptional regulator, cyclic AMP receptor protein
VKICTHSADGKELVLNIIDKGGLFGEVAVLDGEPRTADVVALEETDLIVLERHRVVPFLIGHPGTAIRLIGVLCKRLRQTNAHLEDVLFFEAPSRLARWLLRVTETFGKATSGGTRIDLKLSQQQIGSLVGISRETINKHLGEWTKHEIITIRSGIIIILDKDALAEIAESSPRG